MALGVDDGLLGIADGILLGADGMALGVADGLALGFADGILLGADGMALDDGMLLEGLSVISSTLLSFLLYIALDSLESV